VVESQQLTTWAMARPDMYIEWRKYWNVLGSMNFLWNELSSQQREQLHESTQLGTSTVIWVARLHT
jgi:hypothetical protein